MNCKQGDLAIVVRSKAGNEGKIVTCIRLCSIKELDAHSFTKALGPVWLIDQPINTIWGVKECFSIDAFLRPIRDNDGEDETLTWKDVPVKVVA